MAVQMETARASMRPADDLSRLDRMRSLRCWKRAWEGFLLAIVVAFLLFQMDGREWRDVDDGMVW